MRCMVLWDQKDILLKRPPTHQTVPTVLVKQFDMLVRSYFHTFGMNVVTSNCSNNYGPKQHDEKLIPTLFVML